MTEPWHLLASPTKQHYTKYTYRITVELWRPAVRRYEIELEMPWLLRLSVYSLMWSNSDTDIDKGQHGNWVAFIRRRNLASLLPMRKPNGIGRPLEAQRSPWDTMHGVRGFGQLLSNCSVGRGVLLALGDTATHDHKCSLNCCDVCDKIYRGKWWENTLKSCLGIQEHTSGMRAHNEINATRLTLKQTVKFTINAIASQICTCI